MVHDAQLDYYGCKLATCSSDRTVKIYTVTPTTSVHTATLTGHASPVWSCSWSHPKFGPLLATSAFDGTVIIHREGVQAAGGQQQWMEVKRYNAGAAGEGNHQGSVNTVEFAGHEYG